MRERQLPTVEWQPYFWFHYLSISPLLVSCPKFQASSSVALISTHPVYSVLDVLTNICQRHIDECNCHVSLYFRSFACIFLSAPAVSTVQGAKTLPKAATLPFPESGFSDSPKLQLVYSPTEDDTLRESFNCVAGEPHAGTIGYLHHPGMLELGWCCMLKADPPQR